MQQWPQTTKALQKKTKLLRDENMDMGDAAPGVAISREFGRKEIDGRQDEIQEKRTGQSATP